MNQLLIICGPTASGKTELALSVAKKFNGELVSADSRQIYKGMDIGTGKDLSQNEKLKIKNEKLHIKNKKYSISLYIINKINLWLYDIIEPDERFSVADYYELAWKVIEDIWKRGKLPILVGGTGFYIKAVIDGIETLGVPPDEKLRKVLESKTLLQLQTKLQKINLQKWNLMNNSDRNNKRRLVRALEIQNSIHQPADKNKNDKSNIKTNLELLMIGLTAEKEVIYEKINERVEKRVKLGIINEIQSLLNKGYGWDLYSMSGLGYRQWKDYFEGNESKEKAIEKWKLAECQYSKRQFTWFKKDKRIIRFNIADSGYQNEVVAKISSWYL